VVISRHRRPDGHRLLHALGLVAAMLAIVGVATWAMFVLGRPGDQATADPVRSVAPSAADSRAPGSAAPVPSGSAPVTAAGPLAPVPAAAPGRLLFGIGDEADRAAQFALTRQAPVKMLTSWFNRPSDFGDFMDSWKGTLIPQLYAKGYALHIVEWTPEGEGPVSTKYGSACGRGYPLSSRFLGDMKHLAQIFGGAGNGPPLYVTLFTEFSTYPCVDNEWDSATNYYLALKDQYRAAYQVLHANAANVHVSLGFGGWLGTYDYPQKGGGRSLLSHFTDIMKMSDFQSFQAMYTTPGTNQQQIRAMVGILHPYGPVMLAHYKPDNGNQVTFDSDVHTFFTDAFIKEITTAGLFAMSFMTTDNVDAEPNVFQFVKSAVARYGRSP
jgi:hypothetical protein